MIHSLTGRQDLAREEWQELHAVVGVKPLLTTHLSPRVPRGPQQGSEVVGAGRGGHQGRGGG